MCFSVANNFLSTLDLESIWLSSPHTRWTSLWVSAFSAWPIACWKNTIPYKNPTEKNKGGSKMSNDVVMGLACRLFSWLHPSGSSPGSDKGHSLGLPRRLACSVHPFTQASFNTEWTSIVMWMLENVRTQKQAKCNPCSQGISLSKGKERAKKIINEQQDTKGCGSRGDRYSLISSRKRYWGSFVSN